MNMHPLLLLDNSQSKGSIRVLQQFGYRQFFCCRFLEVFEIVVLIVHKKLVLEWFTINLELQVSCAQFSVPPLHWEQLNKYCIWISNMIKKILILFVFCLPRDRTLAVAGWRREALLWSCQKEHIYPDGKPRTSFCPYEIQWGRTLGPYPGHLSFRYLDLVGTKSRSHSSNLSCSDKLHAMVSANSILICDNKKDV